MTKNTETNTYDASSITVLEGLEPVRTRPGMYIGSIGVKGLNHLVYEILDNAVDEHLAGYCSEIWVTLEEDGSCTVRDNGRGLPVDMHAKGASAERIIMTTLHAGGKFDSETYKTAGGLHGVGASVVNALSGRMSVDISRDGHVYHDSYERGVPTTELIGGLLPVTGRARGTGTVINFLPDDEIFEQTEFKGEWIKSRLHETAYLNPELTLHFRDLRSPDPETGEETVYHEPDGIRAYVEELNRGREVCTPLIYFKDISGSTEVECCLQYVNAFEENILGFCNNIFTQEGGTHITGFKSRYTQLINFYARELGVLKDKDPNFTGADTRNGMTAVLAIKYRDPLFEGQTKTKLASAEASTDVAAVTGTELTHYFDRNESVLRAILSSAEKSAHIRKAAEKAKTSMLTKSKFSFDSNGKLKACTSRDPSKCEIFIVEGDSAGGSAGTARNREFQAVLPIRGKILNVEKASIDKVLANAEIKTMIQSFGCGFSEGYGQDFDISRLNYNKIILMTDADVDGSHIDTLLLTFFYRFMPELIYQGHIYVSMPPLYMVTPKSGSRSPLYLYNDRELKKYQKTHEPSGYELKRFKGLGEMDPPDLWATTLDPERRVLKRVEIEDARLAAEVTELLMGSDVAPRRQFICDHADEADIDT